MESKSELNKKAQELITKYGVDVIYGTPDGQFFLEKNRANLHSKAKNVTVYEFHKDGSEINPDEIVVNVTTLPSPELRAKDENTLKVNKAKKDAPDADGNLEIGDVNEEEKAKQAKEKALRILKSEDNLNLIEYKELVKMVKDLGLEVENAKKETILYTLTTERENLKTEDNG